MWFVSITILQSGRTPLHEALQYSNDEVVEILVKAGADVNIVDEVSYIIKH